MRRKDREVTDFSEIVKIIDRCAVVRLGLADGDFPYIVPLNFAYTVTGRQIYLYVHGAVAGRKYELMRRSGKCSFEMDIPLKIDCIAETRSATMRYESVMGTAAITFLEGEEKQRVMDEIFMARYPETRHFAYDKSLTARTAVARLTVMELSAKANLG